MVFSFVFLLLLLSSSFGWLAGATGYWLARWPGEVDGWITELLWHVLNGWMDWMLYFPRSLLAGWLAGWLGRAGWNGKNNRNVGDIANGILYSLNLSISFSLSIDRLSDDTYLYKKKRGLTACSNVSTLYTIHTYDHRHHSNKPTSQQPTSQPPSTFPSPHASSSCCWGCCCCCSFFCGGAAHPVPACRAIATMPIRPILRNKPCVPST